jgi:hypothetical protein
MQEWIFKIAKKDKLSLGSVRTQPGLRAAEAGAWIWLRGLPADARPDLSVRQLPIVVSYRLGVEGWLFPAGRQTPVGRLPELAWAPLVEFLPLEVPVSAMPAKAEVVYGSRLIATNVEREASALITDLPSWKTYAETAPAARLRGLCFAASEEGSVLVMGTPLPPLPGKPYWALEALLLPAGYDLELPVIAPMLEEKLAPGGEALLLFAPDGSWERIPRSGIVPARRGAIRRL